MPNLAQRARPAALWIGIGMVVNNGTRLLSSLILTRLLAPDFYGLMSIGYVFVAALVMLSDVGLSQCVVQNPKGQDEDFLDTVWTLRLARGAALAGAMLLLAGVLALLQHHAPGWLAGTYADARLPTVVAILAIVPLAEGLESTNINLCSRAVNLRPVIQAELIAQLTSIAAMVSLASWKPAIWILPMGWICQSIVKTICSFAIAGPGNRPRWHRAHAAEIWHFSKWILVSSALTFTYREGDRLLLGGYLSSTELGIYGVGTLLVGAAQQLAGKLSNSIGMPSLAEVARERPAQLADAYRRIRLPLDILCLGSAGLLFGGADWVIALLYDQRYHASAQVLRLFSLSLFATRLVVFDEFLLATGNTRHLFKRGIVQSLMLFVGIPLGYRVGGIFGAIWGVLLAQFSTLPVIHALEAKFGLWDWRQELKPLPVFLVAAAIGWLPGHFLGTT